MEIERIILLNYGKLNTINETIEPDSNSPTGHFLYADDIEFSVKGDTFPAEKGLKFGIEYLIFGETGIDDGLVFLDCKTIHPEIQNPETKQRFTETTIRKSYQLNTSDFDYHCFEFDWEVKKGTYIFQVFHYDVVLLEKEFFLT